MKYILILILMILFLLQAWKMYQAYELNKMLKLKQKQLRVKEEEVSLKPKNPYFSTKLSLSANFVIMLALILIPANTPKVGLKDNLLDNFKENPVMALSDFSEARVAANNFSLNVNDNQIIRNKVYSLNNNTLTLIELNGNYSKKIKEVELSHMPMDLIVNENYCLVISETINEEALKENLTDEKNTVLTVYDANLNLIETFEFRGAYDKLELKDNSFILVTKQDLNTTLIKEDLMLPKVETSNKEYKFSYDNVVTFSEVPYESIYHTYSYDLSNNSLREVSYVLDSNAAVDIKTDKVICLSDTNDGNTLITLKDGNIVRKYQVAGTISNSKNIHKYQGNYYFITSTFNSSLVHKLSADFSTYKSLTLDTYLSYNYTFLNNLLLIGGSDVKVVNLDIMEQVNIINIGDIEYIEKINSKNVLVVINENNSNYVRIYESGDTLQEVSNYRLKTFENSYLDFMNYYQDSKLLVLEQNRGNFDKLVYIINIGEYGIQGINVINNAEVNLNTVINATVINEYLYLVSADEVSYYNLYNQADYGNIRLGW